MKIFFFIIIINLLSLFTIFAQTESYNNYFPKLETAISVNYLFSMLTYLQTHGSSSTYLTWRDIYMNGVQANIDIPFAPFGFEISNIGISYSGSFHGYWTDDDANNSSDTISVTSTNASLLSLSYEVKNINNRINKIAGIDLNFVWLEQHDGKRYVITGIRNYNGLVCKYDIYRFCLYSGFNFFLLGGQYGYIKLTGLLGLTGYLHFADWVLRNDLKHPVSFFDFGIAVRTNSELEAVFNFGICSLFARLKLFNEISLGFNIFLLTDKTTYPRPLFTNFSQSSISIGLMVRF